MLLHASRLILQSLQYVRDESEVHIRTGGWCSQEQPLLSCCTITSIHAEWSLLLPGGEKWILWQIGKYKHTPKKKKEKKKKNCFLNSLVLNSYTFPSLPFVLCRAPSFARVGAAPLNIFLFPFWPSVSFTQTVLLLRLISLSDGGHRIFLLLISICQNAYD